MSKDYSYQYYKDSNNAIIAVSTYAGHTVRGVAKCHPNDTFNEELGMQIAAARCNLKIREKRAKAASRQYCNIAIAYDDICDKLLDAESRCDSAWDRVYEAENELNEILAQVQKK